VLAADCGGVRVVSVYVPNGREVGTDFYDRKLVWLADAARLARGDHSPDDPLVVLGDFNVAPDDRDVWDPKKFVGATHVTPPERDAVTQLEKWGMEDVFRRVYPTPTASTATGTTAPATSTSTAGMRIDLVLATRPVADRVTWTVVDRNARKGKLPSDHAPVIVDLAD
jgi:exodeoxyribonuclease-3